MSFVAVSVGIGVASIGVNIASQASAANSQNRYRKQLGISQTETYNKTVASVRSDIQGQLGQLAQRRIETNEAQQNELANIARETRAVSSNARTQQAAAGVEGASVDALHQQFEQNLAGYQVAAQRNMDNFTRQSDMEAKAIYARGQSIINNGYPQPLPPAATVNIGTSVMNGITTGIGVYGSLRTFATPSGVGSGIGGVGSNQSGANSLFPSQPPSSFSAINANSWLNTARF
jgi:hypothetical protein